MDVLGELDSMRVDDFPLFLLRFVMRERITFYRHAQFADFVARQSVVHYLSSVNETAPITYNVQVVPSRKTIPTSLN